MRAVNALEDKCSAFFHNYMRSEAQEKLSKIASLLEANKDMLKMNDHYYYITKNAHVHEKIADLEVKRRNFQAVIPIYEICVSNFFVSDKLYLLYCLALMVTGKKDSYQATEAALKYAQYAFSASQCDPRKPHLHSGKDQLHSPGPSNHVNLARLGVYWHMFLTELRRMRKWDEALDFTNRFGSYIENCETKLFASEFLYVATYIERYRVEARKRQRDERNKMSVSLYKRIFAKLTDGYAKVENDEVHSNTNTILLYALWSYLNHLRQGLLEKQTAIFLVEEYIKKQYEGTVTNLCLGCEQRTTSSGVGLVCSGCRVACYCCIDHQRSSWKKDLHSGVGIGHKVLCPLFKAYHKYKNARKSRGKNSDEYHSRFRRECEKFLSDGLGLKDLCFSEDFVDENDEEFRFVKWRVEFAAYRLREIQKSGSTKMAS